MKRIQLTQNQFALVDAKNYDWLSQWKWHAWWNKGTKSYYAMRGSKRSDGDGKQYRISMSREILGLKKGDKRHADHINHDTLDNRKLNLRIVTNQQNQWNQKNPKGYCWHKITKKYMSYIKVSGKRIYLGYFDTTKEAHNAYLKAKKKYHISLKRSKMKTKLRKEILAETYSDMQNLIFATAWNFWKTYGGDLDDLIAQANLVFINVFDTYDSNRSKLSTWLVIKIRCGLLDYMRHCYRPRHISIDDKFIDSHPISNKDFFVSELIDELGQDAHIVLQLFLDIPKDVMINTRNSYKRIDNVQAHIRNRLRNRLRQMGWSMRRIREAFEELKRVTSY